MKKAKLIYKVDWAATLRNMKAEEFFVPPTKDKCAIRGAADRLRKEGYKISIDTLPSTDIMVSCKESPNQ